jgi:hypothetical protein
MDNLWELVRIADMFSLVRLQDATTEFMALNIEKLCDTEAFHNYVLTSANSIKNRHIADSIPVVDEIRGYLSDRFPTNANLLTRKMRKELHRKLELIDNVLEKLGLKRITQNTQTFVSKIDHENEEIEDFDD